MRCTAAGFSSQKCRQKARDLCLEHATWILHALFCERCDARGDALAVLAAADLDEIGFFDLVWEELSSGK